ncbi:hypothetical protein Sinac_5090 [Singulisphaera acidiphila DSM 18658]|uniref:Uncharacterized protein n=1 Tax=Singulisphaera acidiphila (strain ATCC BAA-1392 / DSM 18658 / VKM B-2454 / MOB10) TaxID=886293 RepID=L0DJ00_SINAD|nr:hypothetical protein Sinac_5090 [Singulisphaera acidiphila DSM 18658]
MGYRTMKSDRGGFSWNIALFIAAAICFPMVRSCLDPVNPPVEATASPRLIARAPVEIQPPLLVKSEPVPPPVPVIPPPPVAVERVIPAPANPVQVAPPPVPVAKQEIPPAPVAIAAATPVEPASNAPAPVLEVERPAVLAPAPIRGPARADTLIKSAQNLEGMGKRSQAIDFYLTVVREYFGTTQGTLAAGKVRALGGNVPDLGETDRWIPAKEPEPVQAARYVPRPSGRPASTKSNSLDDDAVSYRTARAFSSGPRYSAPSSYTSRSSGPKTVQVRSYTRKDGTFVRSHVRSAPRRR